MCAKSEAGARRSISLLFCCGIFLAANAFAQPELEEIVVTAQKRENTLQREPLAVSAFSGEEIARLGGNDPNVLGYIVPNLHVGEETNRDGLSMTIRGVSGTDVRNAADPTTAFHVDGSYVPRLSGPQAYFYDVERIEVLRGPQGTLYGRNSTAGVVNVITRKPDYEEFSGLAEVTAGDYGLIQLNGVINVPLSDRAAARIAVMSNNRDGYRENAPSEDGDDADELGFRAHFAFEAGENTSILLTAESYERGGVGGVASFATFPNDNTGLLSSDPAGVNPVDTQGHRDSSDSNFRFEFSHSFPAMDLTYLAAYRNHERDFLADADFTAEPSIESFVQETTESITLTHEARVTSTGDGALQYIAGIYLLDEEIDGDFVVGLTHFLFGPTFRVRFVDQGLTNQSAAAFLHTTYQVNDRLRAIVGLRHTSDEKDKGGHAGDLGMTADTATGSFQTVGLANGPTFFLAPQIANPEWNETTWKVGMDYDLSENALLYAHASTGFKAGGYNRGSQARPGAPLVVYNPETVTAVEGGWKMRAEDGRTRLNLAVFMYDYKDLQLGQTFTNEAGTITNQTVNASDASVSGAELEAEVLFGESGRGVFSLGYLRTEFDEFTGVDDPLIVGSQSLSATGNELTRAPGFTASLMLEPAVWEFAGGTLTPRVQFHAESEAHLAVLNRDFEKRDAFTRTDLSLYYESAAENWYVNAYVRNVEDGDVATYMECFDFRQMGVPVQQCERAYAPPRTWGVRAGLRF
ncbi:MAG: TonB-dependent receptor [Gammaproteobacteria bacterium]|nr:TonB-dependent receptor [Gammaproteobacteria bacterium]